MVYDMSAGLLGSCVMAGRGATMHPLQLTPAQLQAAQVAEQQAAAMLVQLEPDSPRSHMFAGDVAMVHGDHAGAAQHLRRCIRLSQALPSRCGCRAGALLQNDGADCMAGPNDQHPLETRM